MATKGTDIVFISTKEYGAFMKKSFENMKKLAVKIGARVGALGSPCEG